MFVKLVQLRLEPLMPALNAPGLEDVVDYDGSPDARVRALDAGYEQGVRQRNLRPKKPREEVAWVNPEDVRALGMGPWENSTEIQFRGQDYSSGFIVKGRPDEIVRELGLGGHDA